MQFPSQGRRRLSRYVNLIIILVSCRGGGCSVGPQCSDAGSSEGWRCSPALLPITLSVKIEMRVQA